MKILIVEDEKSNIEEIERIILSSGQDIELLGVMNPYEALEAVKSTVFDAVFLDIQMPEMNGLTLAEKISSIQPALPFVFITAYNHYATEAFELMAMDYILKPIRPERLLKVIARIPIAEKRISATKGLSKEMRIRAFGGLRLFNEMGEIYWDRPKTRELFALLLMNRGELVSKDLLCDELWPALDLNRALANLQVTVCRLRKSLSEFSREMVSVKYINNYYSLTLRDVTFDAARFDIQCNATDEPALIETNKLYVGEFYGPDGWLWSESVRVEYFKKYIRATKALANLFTARGMLEKAEAVLRTAVVNYEPEDNLCKLFLSVSSALNGKKGLTSAYRLLAVRYDDILGIQVPREVIQEYDRLKI